ncbi:hypothetical protein MKZ38_008349 [Zalerion maritima]|uniref:Nephrocystin 3-like N-terminal domain-containing protein n=1 Tax=Zalerion maritima TaxID=339359 RepID=A0AAD5WVK8_9PEZI|nr:hypothetical protein MKZ38_008349 [Zalerion maritima]
MRDMLGWLEVTNPSSVHSTNYGLRDKYTVTWLDECEPYLKWKSGGTMLLHLYGIPRAGKSVVFSSMVENLRLECLEKPVGYHTTAYYYCLYSRQQGETLPSLRSIISQLCRQSKTVPEILYHIWNSRDEPSLGILIESLQTLVDQFRHVFVMIDALDESQQRQNMLQLLGLISELDMPQPSLLATSRDEVDIEGSLGDIDNKARIPMDNKYVRGDIRKFLIHQLERAFL